MSLFAYYTIHWACVRPDVWTTYRTVCAYRIVSIQLRANQNQVPTPITFPLSIYLQELGHKKDLIIYYYYLLVQSPIHRLTVMRSIDFAGKIQHQYIDEAGERLYRSYDRTIDCAKSIDQILRIRRTLPAKAAVTDKSSIQEKRTKLSLQQKQRQRRYQSKKHGKKAQITKTLPAKAASTGKRSSQEKKTKLSLSISSSEDDTDRRINAHNLEAQKQLQTTIYTKGYEPYSRFLTNTAATTKSSSDSNSKAKIHRALCESTDQDP